MKKTGHEVVPCEITEVCLEQWSNGLIKNKDKIHKG